MRNTNREINLLLPQVVLLKPSGELELNLVQPLTLLGGALMDLACCMKRHLRLTPWRPGEAASSVCLFCFTTAFAELQLQNGRQPRHFESPPRQSNGFLCFVIRWLFCKKCFSLL
jgi:hypothetical protein